MHTVLQHLQYNQNKNISSVTCKWSPYTLNGKHFQWPHMNSARRKNKQFHLTLSLNVGSFPVSELWRPWAIGMRKDWACVRPEALLLAYIVQQASRRGGRSLPAFKEPPDCPAAAQMERPHCVCTQDGSYNATILLGSMITRKEGVCVLGEVLNSEQDTGVSVTHQWGKGEKWSIFIKCDSLIYCHGAENWCFLS